MRDHGSEAVSREVAGKMPLQRVMLSGRNRQDDNDGNPLRALRKVVFKFESFVGRRSCKRRCKPDLRQVVMGEGLAPPFEDRGSVRSRGHGFCRQLLGQWLRRPWRSTQPIMNATR